MGIAKFFAYISERYPTVNEKIQENQIPDFDNLYLDMNGIIHTCTHPKDKDITCSMTEEEMFRSIFRYIEALFFMIKPKKLFFMAVDGVAPRAKINQQRSRRFCSAKTAEMLEARAAAMGKPIPEDKKFDSNCITPGTVFMDKLNKYLKYFVTHNISTNKLWQRCKVIFSGSEVAGEGEHKIMDYIRYMKSQPDYNINTRHCLYGLDADLIMLGLCTHELHFALLREEVTFGKKRVILDPGQTQFYLFHISLMRDYIDHEFSALKETLPFPYDLDKIIDDWILIAFLIGNDFIPHAPNIYIITDGIPILYNVYRQILGSFDGYINEGGTLNLERFEQFMEKLSHLDIMRFSENYADLKFFEAKRAAGLEYEREKSGKSEESDSEKTTSAESPLEMTPVKKPRSKELEALIKSTMMMALGDVDDEDAEDSEEACTERYMMEFAQHKKDYYVNKLNYDNTDKEFLQSLTEDYIRAIQWNLYYYYEGCQSWTWYYPHHYAPYMSDLTNFKHLKLKFEMGEPFLPFEQLLAVLPPYSRRLLPTAFQHLLVKSESPIISYYPDHFETDLNGKRNDWEAVVLIPFIDGDKLRDAMKPHYVKLTDDENLRNKHGPMCIFTHSIEKLGIYKAPANFPDVTNHAKMVLVDRQEIVVPKDKLVKGLSPGVKRDVLYLGFATLRHMEHTAVLKKAEVKVFNMPSRWENMVLEIAEKPEPDLNTVAEEILGKTMYVNWPYLRRARIVKISDGTATFYLYNNHVTESNLCKAAKPAGYKPGHWNTMIKTVTDTLREKRGIEISDTTILIDACLSSGKGYVYDRETRSWQPQERWYKNQICFPYQLLLRDVKYLTDEERDAPKKIADIFLPGTICFSLNGNHYGAMGEVLEEQTEEKQKKDYKIKLCLTVPPKLSLRKLMDANPDVGQKYMTGKAAATLLGVRSTFFARITGTIFVTEKSGDSDAGLVKHNIGLNLKFSKRNEEVPGYTRKVNNQWLYSHKTIDMMRSYMKNYPELFERMWKFPWQEEFYMFPANELFDTESMKLSDVVAWLKENYPPVDRRACGTEALCPDVVQQIEKQLDAYAAKESAETKQIRTHVNVEDLFVPSLDMCERLADTDGLQLFDRVVNVQENTAVPLGHRGIVVAILKDATALETIYEVVFDKPFPGGVVMNGCSNFRGYRLPGSAVINLSNNDRTLESKSYTRIDRRKERDYQDTQGEWRQTRNQPQIHSDPSAFASVSVKNVRLAPQTSLTPPQLISKMKNGNREAEKDATEKTKSAKPASEFQALWNELHEKQKSNQSLPFTTLKPSKRMIIPAQEKPLPQRQGPDPTTFLRAILNINTDGTQRTSRGVAKGVSCLPANAALNNRAPAMNSSTSTEDKTMDAPPLVRQMFHHARQSNESQQNMDRKPPMWWYCTQLLNYYQLSRLGLPRYNYFVDGETNLIRAHIVLPDNRVFVGDPAMTHELAAGSAAKKVYTEVMQPDLKNLVPPPRQWFTNQQNPPRGPPLRPPMMPPMMPNFHTKPVSGPPRFQHWHGKPPPNAPFPQMHIQPRPQHRPNQEEAPKPEVKNITPFVPLQAQKKNRKLSATQTGKDSSQGSEQPVKEAQHSKKESVSKSAKAENTQKEKSWRETSAQSNSQTAPSGQNNQKADGRPRRSRLAAKFGPSAPQPAEPGNA